MSRELAVLAPAAIVAFVLALGVNDLPWLVALPVLPLAGWVLWQRASARFGLVTFGGLLVLQSSDAFDARKVLYLVGCLAALGIAFFRTRHFDIHDLNPCRKVAEMLTWGWIAVVGLSFLVALDRGTDPLMWLRDAIPYLLLAAMPILAMDFLMDLSQDPGSNLPVNLFLGFGIVATIGFAAHWITQRGLADIPLEGLVFSSFAIPGALFSYAFARSVRGDSNRTGWMLLAMTTLVLVMLTGTRSSIIFLAAPLIILLGMGITHTLRISGVGLAMLIFGGILSLVFPRVLGVNAGDVLERFASIRDLTSETVAGQSFIEREAVTRVTWSAIKSSPFFGMGPGYVYEWPVPYSRELVRSFNLDSPLAIAAKFGVAGVLLSLATIAGLFAFQRYLSGFGESTLVGRDAVRGFLAITILISLLGSPIDDKGFSFSLAFLLVIGGQQVLQKGSEQVNEAAGIYPDPVVQPGRLAAGQPAVG